MIKILVDNLPEKSEDCPFAIMAGNDILGHEVIPNCQLKGNHYADNDLYDRFSYSPNRDTCSLHDNKECPYLRVLYEYIKVCVDK